MATKKKKFTHGGARRNAGRKPISDKKATVPIYPRQSRLMVIGREQIQEIAIQAVEQEYKNILQIVD